MQQEKTVIYFLCIDCTNWCSVN